MSSANASQLPTIRETLHPGCVVCGRENMRGLQVDFVTCDDGSVSGIFRGDVTLQGYSELLHGGIIATLLDGAMTNCLFSYEICAMTAALDVRYHEPVYIDRAVNLSASIARSNHRLHIVKAALEQDGKIKAEATGRFIPVNPKNVKSEAGEN